METNKPLKQLMTKRIFTVNEKDSIARVGNIFDKLEFHHLLVIDDQKRLVGVLSDRDYLKFVSPFIGTRMERVQDELILSKTASQIMSSFLITVKEDQSVRHAAELMLRYKISCLPVMHDNGEIAGIVTSKDLLKEILAVPADL
ncbi:CBS domain-containing protein [Leptospira gomenensis]|uniref:CBS domain-containing protein n=2 Tax=Leptospira gomenensis TaxID=2484974 RepID=A0A5F1YN68_9LEPT|nr:CBS domain-containing protein [Leptospira gomenensis]TGK32712.1 CBS domain-containing protein [Leptospira gomenensis]TGK36859.1 CBS domain-containing protein [Leptospira gomenensis]TGK39935.1 CBS domain-containing protein [Leptospira gomenensis]TGK58070.1 CBS domain-containing protein [Leptospira gomenensis]